MNEASQGHHHSNLAQAVLYASTTMATGMNIGTPCKGQYYPLHSGNQVMSNWQQARATK
jgi:hypothetical protein